MLKKYSQLFVAVLFLSDIFVVVFSWVAAHLIHCKLGLFEPSNTVPGFIEYFKMVPVLILISVISLHVSGLYTIKRRLESSFKEDYRIVISAFLIILMMMVFDFFYRSELFTSFGVGDSRNLIALFWFIIVITMLICRYMLRLILHKIRRGGHDLRHVLIVGSGDVVETVAEKFSRHPESGLKVVGILSDNPAEMGKSYHGYKVVGSIDQVKKYISQYVVDMVFIALPRNAYGRLVETLGLLKDEMVDIKMVPDIIQFMWLNSGVEDFDGLPIVSLSKSPMYGENLLVKQMFDLFFSSLLIIVLSPLMLLIALLIKLESKGPAIFKQERMSIGGESFLIYKFRSMKVNAEKHTGPVWATKEDNRRTYIGNILRKTSLDELPQLFNVMKGDMSLVGPRPERPEFVEKFRKSVPKYMLRHKVKAGITGWAQVNGWRGDTSLEERIDHDLYYIENWSPLFDVKILMLTVLKGFINNNAY